MSKKSLWIAIPILLTPYLALFTLATILFSTKLSFFKLIMESVFYSNALYLIAFFLVYCILVTGFSIVCFVVGIYKKCNALSLMKLILMVKIIQIPAYVLIFVLSVVFAITIFTLPFSIGLFLIDCLSLFLTGLGVISAVINTTRQGIFKIKEVFWVIIAQFIFCVDVLSSIVFYIKLKKSQQNLTNTKQ